METSAGHRARQETATGIELIAVRAQTDSKLRFSALMHHFSREEIARSFHALDGKKAVGVDGIDKETYGKQLEQNIGSLRERLKARSYRPLPVRRMMIPKGDGKFRPLGISSTEDKLVQTVAARILEAIFEQDFLECSFGFRPGRGCHDAIRSVNQLQFKGFARWVVDIDIRSYFDTIDHDWLLRCLKERISDRRFLALISRMLKAGILTDGELSRSDEGSPQGSIVSPVLSNVYLHYVLDLWFERIVKRHVRGRAELRRYADDALAFFEHEQDARRFLDVLAKRFGKFGLTLHPEKTRLVCFDRKAAKPGVVDFLGFTLYWGKSRKGFRRIKCKTSAKRLRAKVKLFTEWIKANRCKKKMPDLWAMAIRKMTGHMAYYGVSDNSLALGTYHWLCLLALYKWLNRRSQKRSFTQKSFMDYVRRHPLPAPTIRVNLFVPA